jgi:transposase
MKRLISIPLDIPDVEVLEVETNPAGDYIITVESTIEGTRCQTCGREITAFHGHGDWVQLRHLPILERAVYIRLRPKRYRCPYCSDHPTSTQPLSWYDAKSPHTKAYDDSGLMQLINRTIQDVSRKAGIGYEAVVGAVNRRISTTVDWEAFATLGVLGLDEIALKKGDKDFVVIATVRGAQGRVGVLAVLPDRKKKTVKRFLRAVPKRLKATIPTVCTDMYDGYINAVKETLGSAVVVVDRYHVAKKYRDCADAWRKKELKRRKKELPKAAYDEIKGALWPFRKNKADLEPKESDLLERLFAHAPALKQAYDRREELTTLFEENLSKAEATKKIKDWQEQVGPSELKCFDSFLTTLDNWMDEITNYFLHRQTSSFVEGLNNKLKVLKRRCYGIFNLSHFFQRIVLDLEGYRLFARVAS